MNTLIATIFKGTSDIRKKHARLDIEINNVALKPLIGLSTNCEKEENGSIVN